MWLAFLPFSLWDACHWVTIPASGIIAFLLLGIEEIGVQIEEPFGILALGGPLLFSGYLSSVRVLLCAAANQAVSVVPSLLLHAASGSTGGGYLCIRWVLSIRE